MAQMVTILVNQVLGDPALKGLDTAHLFVANKLATLRFLSNGLILTSLL